VKFRRVVFFDIANGRTNKQTLITILRTLTLAESEVKMKSTLSQFGVHRYEIWLTLF